MIKCKLRSIPKGCASWWTAYCIFPSQEQTSWLTDISFSDQISIKKNELKKKIIPTKSPV